MGKCRPVEIICTLLDAKNLMLASGCVMMFASGAFAADRAVKNPPPSTIAPRDWSGFYVCGRFGCAWVPPIGRRSAMPARSRRRNESTVSLALEASFQGFTPATTSHCRTASPSAPRRTRRSPPFKKSDVLSTGGTSTSSTERWEPSFAATLRFGWDGALAGPLCSRFSAALLQGFAGCGIASRRLDSNDLEGSGRVVVAAFITAPHRVDSEVEKIVGRTARLAGRHYEAGGQTAATISSIPSKIL